MNKPIISVCLCCYNDEPYLDLLLTSLYDNTKVPFEVCIVDNASEDNTLKMLDQKWVCNKTNIMVCASNENSGVKAVNLAAKMAKGKYILDVNSDMIFLQEWATIMLKQLRKLEARNNGFASVSACLVEPYPYNEEYLYADYGKTPDELDYDGLMRYHYEKKKLKGDTIQFSHPIMMSRETWDRIGGISDGYPFPGMCTDLDLGFKLLNEGAKCVMLGNALVYHFSSATLRRMRNSGVDTPPGVQEFINKWGCHPDKMYEKHNVRQAFRW